MRMMKILKTRVMKMILSSSFRTGKKLKKDELKSRLGINKNRKLKKLFLYLIGPSQPQATFKVKRSRMVVLTLRTVQKV